MLGGGFGESKGREILDRLDVGDRTDQVFDETARLAPTGRTGRRRYQAPLRRTGDRHVEDPPVLHLVLARPAHGVGLVEEVRVEEPGSAPSLRDGALDDAGNRNERPLLPFGTVERHDADPSARTFWR